jgi:hypothetical protein
MSALWPALGGVGFAAAYLFLLRVLAGLTGWSRLGARLRAASRPSGPVFRFQSGRLRRTTIQQMLTFVVGRDGLWMGVVPWLRPFLPPLFLPWSEVVLDEHVPPGQRWVKVWLGQDERVEAFLPRKVWDARAS